MKPRRNILVAALALSALPLPLSAQLNSVLMNQMDNASAKFHNARADTNCQYYQRVVRDTTTQIGPIYFLRKDGAMEMGLVERGPDGKAQQIINFKDGLVQIFNPSEDQIQTMHVGANQGQNEKYLTLGFGGSGTDLAQAWNIQDLGPETLTDSSQPVKTEKLDLTSKDPSDKTFSHITIWVDPTRALSLRQIFYLTNNDRRTCNYSNVKLNGHIDTDTFKIAKDKHTTIINH